MSEQLTYSAFESRYQNKTLIGSGGFAKVYKVFDHAKNHYVALKVADVRAEHKKFTLKNEVELVNKLQHHRNIARYDACYRFNTGFTGEMDFALLKFYEYGNLEQFLKREKLELEDKKLIIQGILHGIEFLHLNSIIHRDMKAQNVLMNREDGVWTPKITDFGLSREVLEEVAVENTAIGMSYSYAAPEQIQNKKITKNVDLWAIGVIIYRIIADELPFKGKTEGDDRSTQSQLDISKKIVNLELPDRLDEIPEPYQQMIRRCLVLDPAERTQSARELTDLLLGHTPRNDMNIDISVNNELVDNSLEAPVDNDPTEVINEPEDEGEATQIMEQESAPPVRNDAPPNPNDYAPASNYDLPKENLTQFISPDQKEEVTSSEPDPVTDYEPNLGDPPKKFNPLWIILPLVVVGIAAALWFFVFNKPNTNPRRNANTTQQQGNTAKEAAVATGVAEFAALDQKIEAAGANQQAQSALSGEIQAMVKNDDYISSYQPLFLQAKHQAFLEIAKGDPTKENYRKAGNTLRKAAEVAIINQQQNELLEKINVAENGAFQNLKQAGGGGYFQSILNSLNS